MIAVYFLTFLFVCEGVQNVYICEVGNVKLNGSFEDFVQNVVTSTVQVILFLLNVLYMGQSGKG